MALSKEDRVAFSLKIVSADSEIKSLDNVKAQLQVEIDKLQKLDTANKNLAEPYTLLINSYQSESQYIDGEIRSEVSEQNILDAANKKLRNYFFPNDTNTTVPSLASLDNVWPRVRPFALNYGLGKNYSEGYGTYATGETDTITAALALITSASGFTNIQLTTGQRCVPTNNIQTYPDVQTLKTNLVTHMNNLKATLLLEVAVIPTDDTPRQADNDVAIDNINNEIIPALNTWLAYPDFNTAHGQTTCTGFNAYNSNLLAPTKLHSTELAALQTALLARQTFLSTRTPQLVANLGTITQNITTGEITASSGLYGQRYGFLALRINSLSGSLTKLAGLQTATSAQDQIKASTIENKNTYLSILPTSMLQSPATGTDKITVVDASMFSAGDTVYIAAEGQEELQRAIKLISGNLIYLNSPVPAKYRPIDKARLYKDLT